MRGSKHATVSRRGGSLSAHGQHPQYRGTACPLTSSWTRLVQRLSPYLMPGTSVSAVDRLSGASAHGVCSKLNGSAKMTGRGLKTESSLSLSLVPRYVFFRAKLKFAQAQRPRSIAHPPLPPCRCPTAVVGVERCTDDVIYRSNGLARAY